MIADTKNDRIEIIIQLRLLVRYLEAKSKGVKLKAHHHKKAYDSLVNIYVRDFFSWVLYKYMPPQLIFEEMQKESFLSKISKDTTWVGTTRMVPFSRKS